MGVIEPLNSPTKIIDHWSDQQIDERVAKILRYGVITAAIVTSIGMALYLFQMGNKVPDFHQAPIHSTTFKSYLALLDYWQNNPEQSLVILGLAILVATPIVRVMFSAYAFAKQHDKIYVAITLTVLSILLYSLISY